MKNPFANLTNEAIVKECDARIKIRKAMLGEDILYYHDKGYPAMESVIRSASERIKYLEEVRLQAIQKLFS